MPRRSSGLRMAKYTAVPTTVTSSRSKARFRRAMAAATGAGTPNAIRRKVIDPSYAPIPPGSRLIPPARWATAYTKAT